MIPPVVIIQLYCFELFFEKHLCLNNRPFVFNNRQLFFILVAIATKSEIKRNSFCQVLTACKILNKSNKDFRDIALLIFSLCCRIASATSSLSENEAKNLQIGDVHLGKFLTLKWDILRTIWLIEVSEGFFFCIFALFL